MPKSQIHPKCSKCLLIIFVSEMFSWYSIGERKSITKLAPLNDGGSDGGPTQLLRNEITSLTDENTRLRQRIKELETKTTSLLSEKEANKKRFVVSKTIQDSPIARKAKGKLRNQSSKSKYKGQPESPAPLISI